MAYTVDDFYVGQRVRIREWDDMLDEFGEANNGSIPRRCHFVPEMRDLCGMEYTIKSVDGIPGESKVGDVSFEESVPEFIFSTDMIEPADILRSFDLDAFKSMIGI